MNFYIVLKLVLVLFLKSIDKLIYNCCLKDHSGGINIKVFKNNEFGKVDF